MDIVVSRAEPGDAADVKSLAALSIEVWLDTYAHRGVSDSYAAHVLDTYSPDAFARDLENGDKKLFLCRNDFGLLGYLKLDLSARPVSATSGSAEIETLYIRRHHHRLGLGSLLFREALRCAADAGQPRLFLTVHEGNSKAIAFYEAQGMAIDGSWTFEFEGGAVPNLIMTRKTGF